MAVTGTRTVLSIVNGALRKAGIISFADEAEAFLAAQAVETLDEMLKAWQVEPWMWTRASATLALTTAASYTLSPVRPVRILTARFTKAGIQTPMHRMTRTEYDELPLKTAQGTPSTFYYDRQRESALFYVWPVLAAADGETVVYTYIREIEDVSLNDTIDVPAEWYEAVSLGLAARMALQMEARNAPTLAMLAADALQRASAGEMDEPVRFEPDFS